MDPLTLAITVLQALPGMVTATEEVIQLIEGTTGALTVMQQQKRDPTPEEWDAINAQLEALSAQLNAPEAPVEEAHGASGVGLQPGDPGHPLTPVATESGAAEQTPATDLPPVVETPAPVAAAPGELTDGA